METASARDPVTSLSHGLGDEAASLIHPCNPVTNATLRLNLSACTRQQQALSTLCVVVLKRQLAFWSSKLTVFQ